MDIWIFLKMARCIIFLPDNLNLNKNIHLYGDVETYGEVLVFYILPASNESDFAANIVGYLSKTGCSNPGAQNFVNIAFDNGKLEIVSVKVKDNAAVAFAGTPLIVLYNSQAFLCSGRPSNSSKSLNNYCKILEEKLTLRALQPRTTCQLFTCICIFLNVISLVGKEYERLMPILKYSTIGLHIKLCFERIKWFLKDIIDNQALSIRAGNLLTAVIFDIILGVSCLCFITSLVSTEEFPHVFLWTAENVVLSLRSLLDWLVGSPAGFKLNFAFNSILQQFYVFHTEIWWLFLASLSPGLGVVFKVFTILGWLGITVQAAILSDLLGLVSFHIYCIYAYAARLYNIQLSGLVSLWRLFLGRKKNPLRNKVDSCQYSADQLFVGTLLFTIALFLLPTTLLYYVVFTSFRLVIVGCGGLLTKLRKYLHAVPIYSSILWCFNSMKICNEVRMEPDFKISSPGATVVRVKRVPTDYLTTVKDFVPDCIEFPEKFKDGITGFLGHLIRGDLLYPV